MSDTPAQATAAAPAPELTAEERYAQEHAERQAFHAAREAHALSLRKEQLMRTDPQLRSMVENYEAKIEALAKRSAEFSADLSAAETKIAAFAAANAEITEMLAAAKAEFSAKLAAAEAKVSAFAAANTELTEKLAAAEAKLAEVTATKSKKAAAAPAS